MQNKKFWLCAMILVTIIWGWSFSAIHNAMNHMSASMFNGLRFLLASAFLFAVIAIKKNIRHIPAHIKGGVVPGIMLFAAFAFQTEGIAHTTASNAAFITGTAVIFTPVLNFLINRKRITYQQWLFVMATVLGLGLLTINDFQISIGDLLVLGCAIFTALHIIYLSRYSKILEADKLAWVQVSIVGALSMAYALIFEAPKISWRQEDMLTIVLVGIWGTAFGFYAQTKAQIYYPEQVIAMILVLEPVFGGLFGYFLLNERLTLVNISGAVIIIFSILLMEMLQTGKIKNA